MAIPYQGPRVYDWKQPPFDKDMRITSRVSAGLENLLSAYVEVAQAQAKMTNNNIENYKVTDVYVVGSGARCNKRNSDLDLLLVAPSLDQHSKDNLKAFLQLLFFADRPKLEAVDVYIAEPYPTRPNVRITDQVKSLLGKYNSLLLGDQEPVTEEIRVPAILRQK